MKKNASRITFRSFNWYRCKCSIFCSLLFFVFFLSHTSIYIYIYIYIDFCIKNSLAKQIFLLHHTWTWSSNEIIAASLFSTWYFDLHYYHYYFILFPVFYKTVKHRTFIADIFYFGNNSHFTQHEFSDTL